MSTIKGAGVNTWTSENKRWINAVDLFNLLFFIDDETDRETIKSILEKNVEYDGETAIGITLVDDRFGYGYTDLEVESICTPCLRFSDSNEPENPWTFYVRIPEGIQMKTVENQDDAAS